MNRQQFVDYMRDNFNVSVEFLRLLDNVLHYAELQGWDDDEVYSYLDFMLDCNIGVEEEEIKQITLSEDNDGKRKKMWVCEHCLMAIESHEGDQATLRHYVDEEDENESKCDWCGEYGFDTLYELV